MTAITTKTRDGVSASSSDHHDAINRLRDAKDGLWAALRAGKNAADSVNTVTIDTDELDDLLRHAEHELDAMISAVQEDIRNVYG